MTFNLGSFPAQMNPAVSANSYPALRIRHDNLEVRTINRSPTSDAGADQMLECAGALTPAQLDGSSSSDPDGDGLTWQWTVADGSGAVIDNPSSTRPAGWFPIGTTMVTLTVSDGNGGFDTDDMLVVVRDTTAPVVICTTDVASLWPPNHRMVAVRIFLHVADVCASPQDFAVMCQVSSSEADDATGDGKSTGDVDGANGHTTPVPVALTYDPASGTFTGRVNLRAERNGGGIGRTYSITSTAGDPSGNSSSANCVVVVPHAKGAK
jgi:PKD domain